MVAGPVVVGRPLLRRGGACLVRRGALVPPLYFVEVGSDIVAFVRDVHHDCAVVKVCIIHTEQVVFVGREERVGIGVHAFHDKPFVCRQDEIWHRAAGVISGLGASEIHALDSAHGSGFVG